MADENKNGAPAASTEVALQQQTPVSGINAFGSKEGFELAQREAKMLAASDLVPAQFRGKIENCVIALEMAHRMGASAMMVMQNLFVVHGNPGFSSKFLIATINACGKFSPLRYIMYDESGNEIDKPNPRQKPFACVAYAVDLGTGQILYGTLVDLNMAKAEKWSTKDGSKWLTMPELMLQYRAAAFFQRAYAPEVSMGMLTKEEYDDLGDAANPNQYSGKFNGVGAGVQTRLGQIAQEKKDEEEHKPEPVDVEPVSSETTTQQVAKTLFPE